MRVLIVGADGMLAREIIRQWEERHELISLPFAELDISRLDDVRRAVEQAGPDLVINGAAYNFVDDAETHLEDAYRANALGPRNLAVACEEAGATLVHFSTDFVFDGKARRPYVEYDSIGPLGVYARSKAAGEAAVRDHIERFYLVRLAWLVGNGGNNFVATMLRLGRERGVVKVVNDQVGTPTFCTDVAHALEPLVLSKQFGLYHMTGRGECSWHDFAVEIFRLAGRRCAEFAAVRVEPTTTAALGRPAPRPAYSALRNLMLELSLGDPMPPWQESLEAYLAARKA